MLLTGVYFMNKVILDDFISEFNKGYDEETFNSLEVVNNDSLDQSSIFIKQNNLGGDSLKKIYSISPMDQRTVEVILSEAAKLLPFDGYYIHKRVDTIDSDYVRL